MNQLTLTGISAFSKAVSRQALQMADTEYPPSSERRERSTLLHVLSFLLLSEEPHSPWKGHSQRKLNFRGLVEERVLLELITLEPHDRFSRLNDQNEGRKLSCKKVNTTIYALAWATTHTAKSARCQDWAPFLMHMYGSVT